VAQAFELGDESPSMDLLTAERANSEIGGHSSDCHDSLVISAWEVVIASAAFFEVPDGADEPDMMV
jgi:hypothetical protein